MPMSEYEELQEAYHKEHHGRFMLEQKVDSLFHVINYLRNGAPKLLNEIEQLNEEENWDKIIRIYAILRKDFPNTSELKEATPTYKNALEEAKWQKANNEDSKAAYEDYVQENPEGKYLPRANSRIAEIKKEQFLQRLKEAQKTNSIYSWKAFLEEYPDYKGKAQVERNIIKLEIDNIFSDTRTGKLPATNRTGNYSTSSSSITINNSTSYPLILRYYGPSVLKVTIPAYGNKSMTLSSGSYKVAATAGGLNYAGTEYLSGSYESKYYISSY